MCARMCVCMSSGVYVCVCVRTCMSSRIYVVVYMCVRVIRTIRVRMCVCIIRGMCVCVCMCARRQEGLQCGSGTDTMRSEIEWILTLSLCVCECTSSELDVCVYVHE